MPNSFRHWGSKVFGATMRALLKPRAIQMLYRFIQNAVDCGQNLSLRILTRMFPLPCDWCLVLQAAQKGMQEGQAGLAKNAGKTIVQLIL